MPTPFESAQLNLKLFELRREAVLREARAWFLGQFHPATADDFMRAMAGDRNASLRMLTGYWDMAASLVTFGAIDSEMFLAAHGEIVGTFAKLQPFLGEIRARRNVPNFLKHVEAVVMSMPNAQEVLERRQATFRAVAEQQAAARSGKRKTAASGGTKRRARAR
ncbi:MAG TPA: hypothetical protein VFW98_05415 [Gemmatimonadaceae bacterium]|nr:hypothetical protein [Gemmatimonadaceae bacterium]